MQIWHKVNLGQIKPEPWRNGGGSTRTMLTWPNADWLMRVSVAEISQDGPFSNFPGVDRAFSVLKGSGVRLDGQVVQAGQMVCFAGETAPYCQLIGGATQDLNFMWQREHIETKCEAVLGWACAYYHDEVLHWTEQLVEPIMQKLILSWRRK